MIVSHTHQFDFRNIRFRCACGKEQAAEVNKAGCPACGRHVPKSVSINFAPWISYQQYKLNEFRNQLKSENLDDTPPEHREIHHLALLRKIRELEEGTWKTTAAEQIRTTQNMLASGKFDGSANFMATIRSDMNLNILMLKEELEDAGSPFDDNAPENAPNYFGKFIKPQVTRRDWTEDPMLAVFKVLTAISKNFRQINIPPSHLTLLNAWVYTTSLTDGAHGQILLNEFVEKQDASLQGIFDALHTLGAETHIAILHKAVELWRSKPRDLQPFKGERSAEYAQWTHDVYDPIREEFKPFDEQAQNAIPDIKSLLFAYVKSHQDEFFDFFDPDHPNLPSL